MPTYKFSRGKKTWIEFMSISERTKFLEDNPDVEQLVHGFPADADSVKLGRTKVSDGFNDMLKQIKRNNRGSNIKITK